MSSLALLRIEQKLDLILSSLKQHDPVLAALLGNPRNLAEYNRDICPVCGDMIQITSNLATESYDRTCACQPPLPIVPGISALLKPREPAKPSPEHEAQPEPQEEPNAKELTSRSG